MFQAKFYLEHLRNSTNSKPLSDADLHQASADVDQQIAECKEDANWLEMFRFLLWKDQLQQVVYTIV